MEDKINTFAGLPDMELSKLSDDKNSNDTLSKLRSIEREFDSTNQHTKQTLDNADNTDNTLDTGHTVADNADTTDTKEKQKKNRLGKLMGGTFAVELVDMLIPSLVVLLVSYIGYSLDKKDLTLSKSEKETLSPAVQDCLDDIDIDFNNPWVNLGVMLAIVYGTKIIDKLPVIKKKQAAQPKKTMSEAVAGALIETESIEEQTPLEKFQVDYGKLVDEIRLSRRRGVNDAKEYLANNYSEKIKAIAKKHGVSIMSIHNELNFKHTPKKREPKENDFDTEKL